MNTQLRKTINSTKEERDEPSSINSDMETRTIDPNSSFTKGPQGTDKKIIAIERE